MAARFISFVSALGQSCWTLPSPHRTLTLRQHNMKGNVAHGLKEVAAWKSRLHFSLFLQCCKCVLQPPCKEFSIFPMKNPISPRKNGFSKDAKLNSLHMCPSIAMHLLTAWYQWPRLPRLCPSAGVPLLVLHASDALPLWWQRSWRKTFQTTCALVFQIRYLAISRNWVIITQMSQRNGGYMTDGIALV